MIDKALFILYKDELRIGVSLKSSTQPVFVKVLKSLQNYCKPYSNFTS